jgi:hypothetical protein
MGQDFPQVLRKQAGLVQALLRHFRARDESQEDFTRFHPHPHGQVAQETLVLFFLVGRQTRAVYFLEDLFDDLVDGIGLDGAGMVGHELVRLGLVDA